MTDPKSDFRPNFGVQFTFVLVYKRFNNLCNGHITFSFEMNESNYFNFKIFEKAK